MPEFRLYYDDTGNVLFYTGDKPEGNYIVVDATTFAESRMDCKVVDGVILPKSEFDTIHKLKPSDTGTLTHIDDVCVIIDNEAEGQYWELDSFTLRK